MTRISKVVAAVEATLQQRESIVRITLAEPRPGSRADYFTRYKVRVGKENGSASAVTDLRCVVVTVSSNTGVVAIDPDTNCDMIRDVG